MKQLQKDIISIEEVLSDWEERVLAANDPPLVRFVVGNLPVEQNGLCSFIIKELSKRLKSCRNEYPFLKQVNPHFKPGFISFLLVPISEKASLDELIKSYETTYGMTFEEIDVPESGPLTQQQYQAWSEKFWPFQKYSISKDNFKYENWKQLSRFEIGELEIIKKWSIEVLNRNISMVVLPTELDTLVGKMGATEDCSLISNPLDHVTMKLIAKVSDRTIRLRLENEVPCKKPKLDYIEHDTEIDSWFDATKTYLLTGMDVYLRNEPCIMCSMALLHSRIRRVFYFEKNPKIGGLGSNQNLHCVKELNHRFEVFNVKI